MSTFLAILGKTVFMLKPIEVGPWVAEWYDRKETEKRHTDIATYRLGQRANSVKMQMIYCQPINVPVLDLCMKSLMNSHNMFVVGKNPSQ